MFTLLKKYQRVPEWLMMVERPKCVLIMNPTIVVQYKNEFYIAPLIGKDIFMSMGTIVVVPTKTIHTFNGIIEMLTVFTKKAIRFLRTFLYL